MRYFHIRLNRKIRGAFNSEYEGVDLDNRGGATFAYEIKPDASGVGLLLSFGHSFCNPKDNFNKRVGRVKAEGRWRSLKQVQVRHIADEREIIPIFQEFYNDVGGFTK